MRLRARAPHPTGGTCSSRPPEGRPRLRSVNQATPKHFQPHRFSPCGYTQFRTLICPVRGHSCFPLRSEGMGSGAVRDRRKGFIAPLSPHLPPGDRSIRVLIRHIRSPAFCIRMSSIEPGLGVRISAHWTGIYPRSSFRYRQGGFDRIVRLRFSEAGKTAARLPAGSHARS